ncbi:MAG: hypothetical protein C0617_09295 [Desulfuromonas sp.]|uniref:hypothetical protein n=1 Tax=Desulfuromonas sp. TaxID=892 RepID=UPI000CC9EC93|nr:hypothetical protein [Desulfuromonas sp.]PLX84115.1 MAG: hypothetical protein C0617_09295 [Desulfuromonas sp.]
MLKGINSQVLSGQKIDFNKDQQGPKDPQQLDKTAGAGDRVSLAGEEAQAVTYQPVGTALTFDAQLEILKEFFATTLEKQGVSSQVSIEGVETELTELTPEEAQDLVAEDGFFGVEQTADRVVDFAVGLAGGDPGRFEAIMTGVEEGFRQAEEAWGGKLPEISYETLEAIREKMAEWVQSFEAASDGTEA